MKDKSLLFIVIISFISIVILLLIPDNKKKQELSFQNNLYSSFKEIAFSTGDMYKLASENKYGDNVLNLLYYNKETDDYVSFFIDYKSGKITNFYSVLKKDTSDKFNEVEKSLLYKKYPKFIADGILAENVRKNYRILDNEIIIYYKDVITEPQTTDRLYLKINNNNITEYLNYEYKLDDFYQDEDGYSYDSTKKYIAFTFDDGPSRKNTMDIVNYLTNNKAHATFFMLGNLMSGNTDIIKYVRENNNEIGSHTFSHKNLKRISIKDVEKEMESTDNVYKSITGEDIKLLRPPYGAINDAIKEKFSYPYILWSVDTLDWQYKDSERLYNYVINQVKDGDIVLMHDIHDSTKVAIERILPELYVRGYRVVSVSELAKIKGVTLEPNKGYRSIK